MNGRDVCFGQRKVCLLSSPGWVDTAGSDEKDIQSQILPVARGVASSTETFGP